MSRTENLNSIQQSNLSGRLTSFIVDARYTDIPIEVIRLAKNSFLDTLGIALGEMTESAPQILMRHVKEQGGTPYRIGDLSDQVATTTPKRIE